MLENAVLMGKYDFPVIRGIKSILPTQDIISFNNSFSLSLKDKQKCMLHFFIDDYQFERCWASPTKYIEYLKQFKYVISTDFSIYIDMPKAIQIYNTYKNRCMARYYQNQGVNIIPCVSWSDENSFEWTFDSLPTNSVLAVSTIGVNKYKENFLKGFNVMIEKLKPTQIILIGKLPAELKNQLNIINYKGGFWKWADEEDI